MSTMYLARREQTIYGSETRQFSKNVRDPNLGKYGRGRETTVIDREIKDIIQCPLGQVWTMYRRIA